MPKILKDDYKIATRNSLLIEHIKIEYLKTCVSDLANNRSKGDQLDRDEFIENVDNLKHKKVEPYDEDKFEYLINNYKDDKILY